MNDIAKDDVIIAAHEWARHRTREDVHAAAGALDVTASLRGRVEIFLGANALDGDFFVQVERNSVGILIADIGDGDDDISGASWADRSERAAA